MAETTWVQVADSAVKIGLGALIGGGFSYVVARHHRGTQKAVEDKRGEIAREVEQMKASAQREVEQLKASAQREIEEMKASAQRDVEQMKASAQLDIEMAKLRQERLIEITTKIETFHEALMRYVRAVDVDGNVSSISDDRVRERVLANKAQRAAMGKAKIDEARSQVDAANEQLRYVTVVTSLLGSQDAESALRDYKKAAEDFWLRAGDHSIIAAADYEGLYSPLGATKRSLNQALQEISPVRVPTTPSPASASQDGEAGPDVATASPEQKAP